MSKLSLSLPTTAINHSIIMLTKGALAVLSLAGICHGAIEADRVTSIPGYADGDLMSSHFSGYLPVGNTSGAGQGMLHCKV